MADTRGDDLDDQAVAEEAASRAGEVLLALRANGPGDADALRRAGDADAHREILALLAQRRPADLVLSEEGADDAARLGADRVWIVDPLDGTHEYAERTADGFRDDWAVHVALWQAGSGLTAGAVALPARGVVYGTARGTGTLTSPRPGERPLRLAVSRSHPAPVVDHVRRRLDIETVPMGSAGVKAMAVVTGLVDGYLHDGGQYEWDSAAPVAVARAAGCVARRLDGSELEYNRPSPWLPDLLICVPSIAQNLQDVLDGYRAAGSEHGAGERRNIR